MQTQKDVIACYDKTAQNYADKFIDELSHKHLDRILLRSFAAENAERGKLIDLGCGPGQTTNFLADCGLTDICGADISPEMVKAAKARNPHLEFETADILTLDYADGSFGSAVAFYSIVHFDYEQVRAAFQEVRRVLKTGGEFLFSFHIGDETVHLDKFLDHAVNIDFHFFETDRIVNLLRETGFEMIDVIERQPYENVEIRKPPGIRLGGGALNLKNTLRLNKKTMQISARNSLKGTVKSIEPGAVNTQIVIELSNGLEVVSIITKDSAKRLELTEGKTVYAVVKASDVMIAVD